ncbi:methylated-DNA--[protein]-cysteine S-methyltransferase [Tistrella sp.]|uniref:methylated-DNA--[protein]-cysteine S-methyltransferase n=1 Tax=Tistrella sp. TaxID=2024861 RepID=UPI000C8F2A45|nr:methylated-DNA--[protein]-cysteine S-methyltransferase [Tistrella sp.]MAD36785.1 cysteine methyltransferase [Tistrella sp.]
MTSTQPGARIRDAILRTTGPRAAATRLMADTPLGPIRLAADGEALLALDWIDPSDAASAAEAAKAGPDAARILDETETQLRQYFAGTRNRFDLPLNPAGTEFRRAVWTAMLDIPYGETETYGDMARRVGSVARAVGGACGANPIPIVIPCHRVVGGGYSIGGFSARGGVDTKRFLLHLERARTPERQPRLL